MGSLFDLAFACPYLSAQLHDESGNSFDDMYQLLMLCASVTRDSRLTSADTFDMTSEHIQCSIDVANYSFDGVLGSLISS